MFRVSRGGDDIAHVETIEGVRGFVAGQPPDCYGVDEIAERPGGPARVFRAWGRLTHHPDGRIEEDPWSTEEMKRG